MAIDLEIKAKNVVKSKESNDQILKATNKTKKSAISKVLKCYEKGVLSQDLDIRKINITPNGKYLITCSEVAEKEKPRVCIWSIEKILEGLTDPEKPFIEGELKEENDYKFANWLLCVDAITTEIKGKKIWIVCAGSINGDLYVWCGDIDEKSDEWNLQPLFFKNFSYDKENLRAIFDIKIKEDKQKKRYNIYLASNNLEVISKDKTGDNYIKELCLVVPLNQPGINFEVEFIRKFEPIQDEWILAFDLFVDDDRKFMITGLNDNTICKWNLETGKKIEPEVGFHEDGITCVKIFDNGNRLASGCLNNIIRIWDLTNNQFLFELTGHTRKIVSIDIQKDNDFLISASKDNSIKIWDLDNQVLIRDINVNENKSVKYSTGLDFLRQIVISPKDQYIFALKKDKILIIRNYGRIWHFYQQLKYIEKHHNPLYRTIYGDNLKQIAENQIENEESLKGIYREIKKRLKDNSGRYDPWKLGPLFIPSFVKFEEDNNTQKMYIESVRTQYKSYWSSTKKMFHRIPELSWDFKLFLTTDIEEEIENANFIEITTIKRDKMKLEAVSGKKEKLDEALPYIILKDRNQSQIRFLLVLNNIPTTFIPLLKAIILDVEDDRGDKDKLIFTDFKRAKKNFLKILMAPRKSLNIVKPYTDIRNRFYYSFCTFKLDSRYNTDFKLAKIFIRKKVLEFTESLNPLAADKAKDHDLSLFEAFRNNFHSPITPNVHIQIGKGLRSKIAKIMDNYLAGLVMLDFLFTIISILILYKDIFEKGYLLSLSGLILLSLNIIVSCLIIYTFVSILAKKGTQRSRSKVKIRKGIKVERLD